MLKRYFIKKYQEENTQVRGFVRSRFKCSSKKDLSREFVGPRSSIWNAFKSTVPIRSSWFRNSLGSKRSDVVALKAHGAHDQAPARIGDLQKSSSNSFRCTWKLCRSDGSCDTLSQCLSLFSMAWIGAVFVTVPVDAATLPAQTKSETSKSLLQTLFCNPFHRSTAYAQSGGHDAIHQRTRIATSDDLAGCHVVMTSTHLL